MCSLSPCNPGCDVSAAPRACFCLLTDLQPWIWVPVDVCCWSRTACYWKKKMMLQNQQHLSREPTSCITYPQHLEVLLDHLQAAGFTQHSEMASWVPIWFFLLVFQSWYGERGGGQWVLNVPWQTLAVQNWPSDSSSGGYAMPYSLRGHPVHGSVPCPNLTYRGIGWRSSWVWLHLQYKS